MFTSKFFFMWMLEVVVLCSHSHTIVTPSRMQRDVLSGEITWFDYYDLNDRGRMETGHIFASGAVVWTLHHARVGLPVPAPVAQRQRDSRWEATSVLGTMAIAIGAKSKSKSKFKYTMPLTCGAASTYKKITHGCCYDITRSRVNNRIKTLRHTNLFWHCYV